MSIAVPLESVPVDRMSLLAQRALDATKQLKKQFFCGAECPVQTTADTSQLGLEHMKAHFYQFGIGVLASNLIGTALNESEDAVSTPSVSIAHVRKLAIANRLAAPAVEWDVPVIEHNWTPESYRIRKLVREFNEATHADY
ncbi:MAG: hypothetical protein K9M08_07625 [Pirellula sp.]|nr:hypothetical protein [Pirellula sp.]